MSRQNELAKNTAILTFGRMCTQGISFLLLPLYTAILDTSESGTFDLLITYGTLLLPLVGMQLDQGLFRFMLESRDDIKEKRKLFSTVITADTLQILVFALVLSFVSKIFIIQYGSFLFLYVAVNVIAAFYLQLLRGLGNNRAYAVSSFLSASITVILNVVFLTVLKIGLQGLFISTIAGTGISLLYMSFVIKPWTLFDIKSINRKTLKEVQSYSFPLIPNNLAWWGVNASNRIIISYFLGVAVNGIYFVSNKFSNVFITFYNVFNLSWTETVSLHYQDEDRDLFLSDTITKVFRLFSGACFGIVAIMPFVFPILVNKKYEDAYQQIIILMYAMIFRVLVGLYSCVYIALKETKKIAYTSMVSAVINITINCLLINRIGLYAASMSTLIAFGAMAVFRYYDVNKYICMRIDKRVLSVSAVLGIGLLVSYYINNSFLNAISLIITVIYVITLNWDLLMSLKNVIKSYVHQS